MFHKNCNDSSEECSFFNFSRPVMSSQHDRLALATLHTPKKYLLWSYILAETDRRFPVKRFNAQRCKYTVTSVAGFFLTAQRHGRNGLRC